LLVAFHGGKAKSKLYIAIPSQIIYQKLSPKISSDLYPQSNFAVQLPVT